MLLKSEDLQRDTDHIEEIEPTLRGSLRVWLMRHLLEYV